MKALRYICLVAVLGLFAQCKDYLDVTNPGNADNAFVTSTPEETWKLLSWAYSEYRQNVAAGGNYNFQDPLGSDAEYLNEYPTQQNNIVARLQPELTPIAMLNGQYNALNSVLARAARVADAIAENPNYQADAAGSAATVWTHLYGEARTLWAQCYFMLATHWGDIPFGYENKAIDPAAGYELTSRFVIFDEVIAMLKSVEGKMFPLGQGGITAERLSRTYANSLIGETALFAGSYQTVRTDVAGLYGDVTFENAPGYVADENCTYARRTDYATYLQTAATYLDKVVNDASVRGSARLNVTDPRSYAENPFQYIWGEVNSRRVSPESIWETGALAGQGQGELPYSQGRPGSNNRMNALLNCFAAIRMIPSFFYTGFEEGDMRKDASMVITGIDAASGAETLLPFGTSTRITGGGPATNKWDHQKADIPQYPNATNRSAGVNHTILRMADAMLMLAEAKAQTGDGAGALALVNQIRARAFGDNTHAVTATGTAVLDAVYAERKLELLSEGDIRWDMIRSGKFNERAIAVRQLQKDMIDGLRANGYFTFGNGKTISKYVFTKKVYLDGASTTGVTYDAAVGETNPALTPGWRGVYDWTKALSPIAYTGPRNLAVKGLYENLIADSTALKADGYAMVPWGVNIVTDADGGRNIYDIHILDGVKGRENMAPRYFHPLPLTIIDQSKGKVTNGYGLPQQ